MNRRELLAGTALAGAGLGLSSGAQAAPPATLPPAQSLQADLAAALAAREPLVVMVSLDRCPYCHAVRQSHLAPMARAGEARIVQVDMNSTRPLVDAGGATGTHGAWVRARGVKVAPTVLFLGAGGQEVAERLTGALLPDFYGAYLDERLATARKAVRGA